MNDRVQAAANVLQRKLLLVDPLSLKHNGYQMCTLQPRKYALAFTNSMSLQQVYSHTHPHTHAVTHRIAHSIMAMQAVVMVTTAFRKQTFWRTVNKKL